MRLFQEPSAKEVKMPAASEGDKRVYRGRLVTVGHVASESAIVRYADGTDTLAAFSELLLIGEAPRQSPAEILAAAKVVADYVPPWVQPPPPIDDDDPDLPRLAADMLDDAEGQTPAGAITPVVLESPAPAPPPPPPEPKVSVGAVGAAAALRRNPNDSAIKTCPLCPYVAYNIGPHLRKVHNTSTGELRGTRPPNPPVQAPAPPARAAAAGPGFLLGSCRLQIDITINFGEINTWSPERITALFEGLAKMIAAKNQQ